MLNQSGLASADDLEIHEGLLRLLAEPSKQTPRAGTDKPGSTNQELDKSLTPTRHVLATAKGMRLLI